MPNGQDENTKWKKFMRRFNFPKGMSLQSCAVTFMLTIPIYALYLISVRLITFDQAMTLNNQALLIFAVVMALCHHDEGGKPAGLGPWKPLP